MAGHTIGSTLSSTVASLVNPSEAPNAKTAITTGFQPPTETAKARAVSVLPSQSMPSEFLARLNSLSAKIEKLQQSVEKQDSKISGLERTVTQLTSDNIRLREENAALAEKLKLAEQRQPTSSSSASAANSAASLKGTSTIEEAKGKLETGEAKEKLDVVVNLLKGINGKYGKDFSWDEIKKICGNHITVPSGGGHGDVFFITDTKYVLKQNLIDQEYSHYKFLDKIDKKVKDYENNSMQGQNSTLQSATTPVRRRKSTIRNPKASPSLSQAKIAKLAEMRKSGASAFRPPIEIGKGSNGKGFIVIQNALYDAENKQIAKGKTQVGDGHTNNLFDFKIGNRAVFNGEQIYAGARKENNTIGLFLKKMRVLWNHVTNPSQGAALVGKDGISVDGKKLSTNGATSAKNTEEITSRRAKSLSEDQLKSIIDQLTHTVQEAKIMPVAFVGSSIVIGFPEGQDGGTPQVMPIDYAHPIYEADITEGAAKTKFGAKEGEISKEKYVKIKQNYVDGIQYLLNIFIKEQDSREIKSSIDN